MYRGNQTKVFQITRNQALIAIIAFLGITAAFMGWFGVTTEMGSFEYTSSISGLDSPPEVSYGGDDYGYEGYIGGAGIITAISFLLVLGITFSDDILKMSGQRGATNNGLLSEIKKNANLILIVMGAISLILAAINMNAIGAADDEIGTSSFGFSAQIGLYLTLLCGLGILLIGGKGFMDDRKRFQAQHQQFAQYQQPGQYQQQYQQQYPQPAPQPVPQQNQQQQYQQQPAQFQQTAPQAPTSCPRCGTAVNGVMFCGKCGYKVQ